MSRLRGYFETVGNPIAAVTVVGFAENLPFVGITSLGWVLLKGCDAEPREAKPSESHSCTSRPNRVKGVF